MLKQFPRIRVRRMKEIVDCNEIQCHNFLLKESNQKNLDNIEQMKSFLLQE